MTRKRTIGRSAIVALILGVLVGSAPGIAYAAVYSPYITWSSSPYAYKGRSGVNGGSGVYAIGQVAKNASGTVPAGYMGAGAYLYKQNSNGTTFALCKSATVTYTTAATSLYNRFTSGSCGSGNYRGLGLLYTYNANDGLYNVHGANNSPAQGGS